MLNSNQSKFFPISPGDHITGVKKKSIVTKFVIREIKSLYLRQSMAINEHKQNKKNIVKTNEINIEGDHAIFTFSVSKFKTLSKDCILTFKDLIHNKIIL